VTEILEVVAAGLLSTIQDGGRPGYAHLGVPSSGPCDPWAHAVANLLAGNEPTAAALEMTLEGPDLRAVRSCTVALAGADLGAITSEGRRLAPGRSHPLAEGVLVRMPGTPGASGCRAYLAVPGGFELPPVLGSRSTCLAAGFGGLDGRPLRAGDRLACSGDPEAASADAVWPAAASNVPGPRVVRVLPGPDASLIDPLLGGRWTVSPASNRMGVRLAGPPIDPGSGAAERVSQGIVPGTIQVPPGGLPIALLADAQTTGGYPVPAIAITADLTILGQLRPGDEVRFETVAPADAVDALHRQREAMARGTKALAESKPWNELWRSARG
jgi:antagonist of KipI